MPMTSMGKECGASGFPEPGNPPAAPSAKNAAHHPSGRRRTPGILGVQFPLDTITTQAVTYTTPSGTPEPKPQGDAARVGRVSVFPQGIRENRIHRTEV